MRTTILTSNVQTFKKKRKSIVELSLFDGSRRYVDGDELKKRSGARTLGQTRKMEDYLNSEEGQAYAQAQDTSYFLDYFLDDAFPKHVNDALRVVAKNLDDLAEVCAIQLEDD